MGITNKDVLKTVAIDVPNLKTQLESIVVDSGDLYYKLFNIKGDYDEATDTGTNDTQALQSYINSCVNNKRECILPKGNFLITNTLSIEQYRGLKLKGKGVGNTVIYMKGNNLAIIKLIGKNFDLEGVELRYVSQQPKESTNSIGLHLLRVYNSSFRNILIQKSNTGVGQLNSDGQGTHQFSNSFDNISIQAYSYRGFNIEAIGNTGSTYNNIYINNQSARGSETILTAETGFYMSGTSESSLSQINVEWSKLDCAFKFVDCGVINLKAIHTEGVKLTGVSKGGVFSLTRIYGLDINSIEIQTIECLGSWKQEIFYIEGLVNANIENIRVRDIVLNGKQLFRFYSTSTDKNSIIKVDNFILLNGLNATDRIDDFKNNQIVITKNQFKEFIGEPISGYYNINDRYYNSDLQIGGYIGGVVLRQGYKGKQWKKETFNDANISYVVPSVDNGHCYMAITSGTTGVTEPIFPITSGATVTDGGVIWKEIGQSCIFSKFGKIE